VVTYNNGLADTIRNNESVTKTFWWEGSIYEKLIFKTKNDDNQELTTKDQWLTTVSFRVSPFSFFQTNTLWAQQLFNQAMNMVGHIEWTILDLYCGTGTIGISFLKLGKWNKLVWIEIVQEAITDAWYNAKINGLEDKVIFLANPAEKAFTQTPEIKEKLKTLGLVIIDPPRDGLHKNVVQMICDLKKESDFKLLYISCNPVTMVRDIELLIQWGFSIKEIQPVDMFPQTHHIECIGILS
jgi:23S rRNA (uracil1939-C5)-methyltransferase